MKNIIKSIRSARRNSEFFHMNRKIQFCARCGCDPCDCDWGTEECSEIVSSRRSNNENDSAKTKRIDLRSSN